MITSISIENFQSHKKTKLDLSAGVNVFIGESDSGKTAILRALKWLIENRPLGDDFRSKWGGDTKVRADVGFGPDGDIVRSKSKTGNTYALGRALFKAIGTEVPKEISEALNIGSINVSEQLDPPFLLSASPGEVAQTLNKIVNLEELDTAQFNIAQTLRKVNQDMKYAQGQQAQYIEDLKQYEYLDKAEVALNIITELDSQIRTSRSLCSAIEIALDPIEGLTKKIADCNEFIAKEKILNALIKNMDHSEELTTKFMGIQRVLDIINTCETALLQFKEVGVHEKALKQAEILSVTAFKLVSTAESLSLAVTGVDTATGNLDRISKELETAEKEFKALMPNICPLCNQPVLNVKPLMRRG